MRFLALTLPDGTSVQAPSGLPSNLTDSSTIYNIPQFAVTLLIVGVVVLSIVMILFSGIQWITSQGDPKAIEGARKRITYAVIGLIVAMASFIIVSIAITLLGGDPNFFHMGNFTGNNPPPCSASRTNSAPC